MRSALLALVLELCGCREPEGVEDRIPIFYLLALPHHDDEVLTGAGEILGMQLVVSELPPPHGAVVLVRLEQQGPYIGETRILHQCSPVSWSTNTDTVVAHEIGHALGLLDLEYTGNVMDSSGLGDDIEDWQVDQIRRQAWYLWERC